MTRRHWRRLFCLLVLAQVVLQLPRIALAHGGHLGGHTASSVAAEALFMGISGCNAQE
ncbi:MAG TPA: hypothetical protein VM243_10575 [Phycisphaerae bacterium]|nr:hypothetical protein [Phycisphaerae bacterium]